MYITYLAPAPFVQTVFLSCQTQLFQINETKIVLTGTLDVSLETQKPEKIVAGWQQKWAIFQNSIAKMKKDLSIRAFTAIIMKTNSLMRSVYETKLNKTYLLQPTIQSERQQLLFIHTLYNKVILNVFLVFWSKLQLSLDNPTYSVVQSVAKSKKPISMNQLAPSGPEQQFSSVSSKQ